MKLPKWTNACAGRSGYSALTKRSLRAPELMTKRSGLRARQTSTSRRMERTKASDEKGMTMPDVPTMEIPSTMPSFGLNVCRAIFSPSGTAIVTSKGVSQSAVSSRVIISRGVRLMAGPPISRPRPGNVTRPTPSPCKKRIPSPSSSRSATVAQILQPFVTSGSSPASLITAAVASRSPRCVSATGSVITSPSGRAYDTSLCSSPVSNAISAALAAAVAHDPVV